MRILIAIALHAFARSRRPEGGIALGKTILRIGAAAALLFSSLAIAQAGKDLIRASGEVLGTLQIRTSSGTTRELVKLQRADGGRVVVDLGKAAARVQRGERVFVQGHPGRISGKPVIFARYVAELPEGDRRGEPDASTGTSGAPVGQLKRDDFGYYHDGLEWTSADPAFESFYSDAENAWDAYGTTSTRPPPRTR